MAGQGVELTPPFQRLAAAALCALFGSCEALNLVGTVYDLCSMADGKRCSSGVKIGALAAIGDLAKLTGDILCFIYIYTHCYR
jgi:hypothetical protein